MYREIGIRSHGRGIFHKPPVTGLQLGTKKMFAIEPGDFVLNIVFAWEGAVGVAGPDEAGMVASHRFPTFRATCDQIDARYLQWFFRTRRGLALLRRVSPGGAGRNRTLNREAFLDQVVPLPAPEVRRRLVTQADEVLIGMNEVRSVRGEMAVEVAALLPATLNALWDRIRVEGTLGDVLTGPPRNGWSAKCDNAEGGTPVLSLGAVTGFRYRATEFKRTSLPVSANRDIWLNPGDLLMTRSNTAELVGHVAIYSGQPSPCIYPDLMMRLPLDEGAEPLFVWYWLQRPQVREFIRRYAKGTSPTMKKISQGTVMNIPFPSALPRAEQRQLALEMDRVRDEIDVLRQAQAEADEELKILLPAIVEAAFDGGGVGGGGSG